MTARKADGSVNWATVGPALVAAVLALTGAGGAVGGQAAVSSQVTTLQAKVAQLEACDMDKEQRLRVLEKSLGRIEAGIDVLLAERRGRQP